MNSPQQNIHESIIEAKPTYDELARAVASYGVSRPGGVDAATNARLLDLAKRLGRAALPLFAFQTQVIVMIEPHAPRLFTI